MKGSSLASRSRSLVCPLCEAGELKPSAQHSARCGACAGSVSGAMLEALRQIVALPDALGTHACEECAHPEMRRLPDGTFHCPACRSEVLPIDASATPSRAEEHAEAYWAGWVDGRFGERGSFADNPDLVRWGDPSERLSTITGATVQATKPVGPGTVRKRTTSAKSSSDEEAEGPCVRFEKGGFAMKDR
jgi:ribosomal protein L37AE/L43A